MKTVKSVGNVILAQLAKLSNPATDAALIALVVQLIPGVKLDVKSLAGIFAAVGAISGYIRAQLAPALAAKAITKMVAQMPRRTAPGIVPVVPATPTAAPTVVSTPDPATATTPADPARK